MELDEVAEGVAEEDLHGLRAHHALGHEVVHAEPVELPPCLLDIWNGEGDVRERRIASGSLGELGLPVHPHEVDLGRAAHVHPVPADGRDARPPGISVEPEDVRVEPVRALQILRFRADADTMVMQLEHLQRHRALPAACPRGPGAGRGQR